MTKRERMLKESLMVTRNLALRALGGDSVSVGVLADKLNLNSKTELLAFVSAMNLSIEAVVMHSRKDAVLHESKWICSDWLASVGN